MVGGLRDVITCAEFQIEIFMGYDFTGGRIFDFPIDFSMGLTTVQRSATALPVIVLCTSLAAKPWFRHPYRSVVSCLVYAGPLSVSNRKPCMGYLTSSLPCTDPNGSFTVICKTLWNACYFDKKLSCRRETAWRFLSLNILVSHSRSLEVIRYDTVE